MIEFVVTLLVFGVLLGVALASGAAAAIVEFVHEVQDQVRAERVRASVQRADAELRAEHHRARRAMHEAAGQSWRTRFE